MKKRIRIELLLLCALFVLSAVCLTGCAKKEPEKKAEETRYIDPVESLLPQVPEGYYYHEVPKDYTTNSEKQGTLELLTYTSFDKEGKEAEDHAYVYLPYGYDSGDASKKYNVFYMSHGGHGDYYTMFYDANSWRQQNQQILTIFKRVLDNMIEKGDIEPLIVVCPTYTLSSPEYYQQNCFRQCLLPAVEGKYHTYAASTSEADLKASRDHRAFGGYSMGCGNTWYCFQYNLEYVKWFMPMSGVYLGAQNTEITATVCDMLEQTVKDAGMTAKDFYIAASTGVKSDDAYEHVKVFYPELAKHSETFVYTNDFHSGNLHIDFGKKNLHSDVPYGVYYIYNSLPRFFREY